jgi:hypothetical protein
MSAWEGREMARRNPLTHGRARAPYLSALVRGVASFRKCAISFHGRRRRNLNRENSSSKLFCKKRTEVAASAKQWAKASDNFRQNYLNGCAAQGPSIARSELTTRNGCTRVLVLHTLPLVQNHTIKTDMTQRPALHAVKTQPKQHTSDTPHHKTAATKQQHTILFFSVRASAATVA